MTSLESPAGARRRVRLALREARLAKGDTQGQVAEAMEWSQSKVIRIESGEVTISPNDLRPLLAYLGITDKATVDKLVQDARASRRRAMWWDEPLVREHLTPASRQLIQYELEAVEVRSFTNIMIPGRLQTDAYARTVLAGHHGQLSDEAVEVRLDTRRRRRDELLARRSSDFPPIYLLLDEGVLRRYIGDAEITSAQLRELLRVSREKPLRIRVLPYASSAPVPAIGPFDILNLPGKDAVLYRESHLADEIVEDARNVKRHVDSFDTWWKAAMDEQASAVLIADVAKELSPSGSQPEPPRRAGRSAAQRKRS